MQKSDYVGRVVYSNAGRDKGIKLIIIDVIDEEYVNIADGNLRKVEKPKKKKIKHLNITDIISVEIKKSILSGAKVSNSKIKKFLQSVDDNKEV